MSSIIIKIDTSKYRTPTTADIDAAKTFVVSRNDYARTLEERIDEVLKEAEERIITICYKYNVVPTEFEISSDYNEQLMAEIAAVMDEIEEDILGLIEEYAIRVTNDRDRAKTLLAWMLLLGRNNRNLRQTLDGYLYKFMKDVEAAVAAMKYANLNLATAVTRAKTYLHTIYIMPEIQEAFKTASTFTATYIRSRGVAKGGVGLSNNGSTNVTNLAKTTLQMVWMRSRAMDYQEQGAAGIYVLRGSNYPCELCDDAVGFYPVADAYGILPIHPHCCCYAIPIFEK